MNSTKAKSIEKTTTVSYSLAILGYRLKKAGSGERIFNQDTGRYCIEDVSGQVVDFYSVNGVLLGSLSYATVRELAA